MEEEKTTGGDSQSSPEPKERDVKPMGPAVGTVIIIIILIIGGLYLWGAKLSTETLTVDESVTAEDIISAPDEAVELLQTQSSSDDIGAIENDLNATDVENLDIELQNIEAELGI